jgi:hypothetical protein
VRGGADRAVTLAALIRRLPTDVARYKSIEPYRESVLAWLDQIN